MVADLILDDLQRTLLKRGLRDSSGEDIFPAAVLLLIYPTANGHVVNFQKRSLHVQQHKGEICLPGGRPEDTDTSLIETALRETHEEEGINPEDVTIFGQLDDVATKTGYTLKVFIGTIPHPYIFTVNSAEVEEILEIPLSSLQDQRNWREEAYSDGTSVTKSRAYAYGPHLVYGATANIVGQLLHLISDLQQRGGH